MNVTFQRLLSRGDLPDSGGGCYNPSAWVGANGQLHMLVRRESDYTWQKPSYPTLVDPITRKHTTLIPLGFPKYHRVEDCRVFPWRGQNLVTHVDYRCLDGQVDGLVRQRISVIEGDRLGIWDHWDLPFPLQPCEKNWVLGSVGDDLFMVYSLDPFIVCRRASERHWELVHSYDTGLTQRFRYPLRNSTHLIPFDGGWLGFYHFYKRPSRYQTGAYWLDSELRPSAFSDVLIDGSWVVEDAYKAGVYYVSSAILQGDHLKLFAGEGDRHCNVATLSVADVRFALRA